ncbi:MAG TPA: HAD hydrolase-like protein [Ideonella sp.]|uniref:HAD family hydrolase n=1 Tax=Ideonella sp. TaxID=1929293 RepID=UPI002CF8BC30|nr:HAD hydrolase-like protein [Ideonella sp.]HSI49859.1 HAD hydrolase-like protein [Ideonella sp.]
MPYDLILFDLDGTLSDPAVGIGRSINHALLHHGHVPLQPHEVPGWIGPPLDESFRGLTGGGDEALVLSLVAKYRERYGELGYAENTLYSGVPQALQVLTDAGVAMGVCTSKRVDFAEQILEMFGLRHFFGFVSGGDVGVHKWQQIAALRERGVIKGPAVMVGDRAVDLIAARRNGLHGAGVLWGHGSHAELAAEQPHHLFREPAEWRQLLGG